MRDFLLVVLLSLGLILALPGAALADGDEQLGSEPQPRAPEVVEGSAAWLVGDMRYQGEFPEGMTFEIKAASDAGPIVNARVVWTHAPGNNTRRSRGAEFNEATGHWVAQWPHNRGDVPPWVLVRYRWELTDAQGNRYFTAEQDAVYADASNAARWHSAESDDVVVYWIDLPDEFGEQTLEAMAAQREFYRQAWGGLLPYRPRVILYGTSARTEYEEALGRQAVAGGGITTGTTSDDWGGTIQYALFGDTAEDLAYGTVLHEVAHLYQGEFAQLPVGWFVEGNAEFFSLARGMNYREWGRQRLLSGDPLSFAHGFSIRGQTFRDGYQLGATVFDYLVETYGLDAHRQVWELIGQNTPSYEAIERVTGLTIDQFELDWRRWMGVDGPPPTLAPSPTPPFDPFSFPTPTYSVPGG
ncbi:MAG: hypothetical protein JXN59_13350 [Anaerolineae bacterium]|nr:hypothetical protein [Anaerolineae bacterium]